MLFKGIVIVDSQAITNRIFRGSALRPYSIDPKVVQRNIAMYDIALDIEETKILDDITNAGAKLSLTPKRCERIAHWTKSGAQLSETVAHLLEKNPAPAPIPAA